MKNYINFVNDHSGSMYCLREPACKDFNANIKAIKDAASREMLDTVVSVCEIGEKFGLTVTVSNPHVLKEKKNWEASGGTPLWTGTSLLIDMLKKLPDANKEDVSFLVILTTDGQATDPEHHSELKSKMQPLLETGRWTFVARVPKDTYSPLIEDLMRLGIPEGNIQFWETTAAGMQVSTQVTTQAMDTYFSARSAGAKSSNSFYADASKVNVTALNDITSEVSLYVVPAANNGIEIKDFILKYRMEYLKGAAFYQLTKTEARVAHTKQILVRDRSTGKIYAGKEARKMIGLPTDRNARLHPGDHKNYDLFIQSESVNRKLVGGTGVVYWPAVGVPFTEADLAYLKPKTTANGVVELPPVTPTNKPTPSPIPVAKKTVAPAVKIFPTREDARRWCRINNLSQANIRKDSSGFGWVI